jgi:hypothetical protein
MLKACEEPNLSTQRDTEEQKTTQAERAQGLNLILGMVVGGALAMAGLISRRNR